ncbi:PAS domain S-box-containing protein/diguanylate cyclase (GGDEF) domain-containing protein [Noviherbaspirillum humi]|uniref:PAS domain S-box-containing protein/diguanylate cyclase (GGDEF) domain-containing protein n=1 Tax=Noviherbaspirillum humi TaxID=1688639 RepID=A0A239J9N8_9BURK|nr:bifunctional diguanylate cyclase/phosphodiesterase [Noviherbaspirillum humi]SNT02499.1 PAS domain S-box-containing protein/diguanylate cyclase (GGDEF) domain-containing protein [Noviherbaspirillum humi]
MQSPLSLTIPAQIPSPPSFDLAAGGEMGALVRATDWSATPLGPLEAWPQSLRTAVSIVLNSGHPMFIAWGPQLNFLFNDAYRPILGAKAADPASALGKPFAELWSDIWSDIEPLVRRALAGESSWYEDMLLRMQRNGFPEDTYFTFSYSPVWDDAGRVAGIFCACIETTGKVRANRQRAEAVERLQIATEAAQLGLFDYDVATERLTWSERTREHFGVPPDMPASGDTFFVALHPEDRERMRLVMQALFAPGASGRYEAEYRVVGIADGRLRWIAAKGQVFHDPQGKPMRLVGTTMDITERKLAEQRVHEASQHDTLTGLPNRALLFEYCEHLIAMRERAGAGGGAVLFIDLDRFKPINDTYGHETGDKVLQAVARRLQGCTRKEDIVSRLGGDEFVVVLPRIDGMSGPSVVAQHIIDAIGQPIEIGTLQLSVSPSIGISLFPAHSDNLDTLIRCADQAMYEAKKNGRNTFRLYSPGMDGDSRRLQLEIQIKEALQSKRLALHYQPIIDMENGKLIGAEALMRMPDEDGSLRSPADVIPVAEAAGLINQLGAWVAGEACRQHQQWLDVGLPSMGISINVSPGQFRQHVFTEQLQHALQESGMDPHCLQIELTESAVLDNLPQTIDTLTKLRAMGVRIALDDFGTGYSSLGCLSSLPLDQLKIGQSVVSRFDSSEPSKAIADAIIALGRSLNLKVVGEGIESEETREYLRSHGCDQAQGYFFSEPLPAPEFEAWCWNYLEQGQRAYH